MIKISFKSYSLALFIHFFCSSPNAKGQVSIPHNTVVSQNFSALGSSATASLPTNWKVSSAGSGLTSGWTTGTNVTATTQAANSGTPTTGGTYNWGTTPGIDRALGFMTSGSYASPNSIMAYYRNATGVTVNSITVSFQLERYRVSTDPFTVSFVPFALSFFSSNDGSAWTARASGDISGGAFSTEPSAYTFTSPQTILKSVTITGLAIPNNGDFYLRWVFNAGSNPQGIGLDDVRVFAGTASPVLSATLSDSVSVDNNIPNQTNAGDQLRYTTKIKNSGTGDANGVQINIPAPTNTTLVAGSVKTSALARDDNFTTGFNTTFSGGNVLTNDFGLPGPTVLSFGTVGSASSTTVGSAGTTDNGGTLTVNADGSFTYTPPTGFTGNDRFAYIASTGTLPNNDATVIIAVGTAATATADAYNAVGNVSISLNGATGVLANDNGSNRTVVAVNGNAALVGTATTTAQGGNLTLNGDGSFTYNPPAGYEGTDNFAYTIDNGFSSPSTVTVTLTVSGMIWFINNAASAGGDGRLSSPFNSTTSFNTVNNGTGATPAAGDNIFIYESNTSYGGLIVLLNNQKLIGQDATSSLASITGLTPPSYSTALPAMSSGNGVFAVLTTTAAGSNVVTLNSAGGSNRIQGLTVGDKTGIGITGTGFGTLTVSDVSITGTGQALRLTNGALNIALNTLSSSNGTNAVSLINTSGTLTATGGALSGSTGAIVNVSGGSVSITYPGNITQGNNAAMVSVAGAHTGTITFQTGTLSATNGTGLQFDNADGTYNFNGTTTLNGGDAGIDILNGSNGSFTFSNAPITNPTGAALVVNGGAGIINHSGAVSKNNSGRLIDMQSRTGGSITVTGNLSSTGTSTGLLVQNNSGGTITLSGGIKTFNTGANAAVTLTSNSGTTINLSNGGLSITTTTGNGFNATGGGTVNVTGTGNVISSPTATALNVSSTTIGAGGLTFQSISSNGGATPANGIILNATGSLGGLTVTGTGTAASGGTIANKTGADGSTTTGVGIYLNNTSQVSLARMQLNDFQNFAIRGTNVSGFSFTNGKIDGVNGNSITADNDGVANGEDAVRFTNLTGIASILNSQIGGGHENIVRINNTSGTLNRLTISNCTIGDLDGAGAGFGNSAAGGDDGLLVEARNNAVVNVTIDNSIFNHAKGDLFQLAAQNASTVDLVLRRNQFSNGHPNIVSGVGGVTIGAVNSPVSTPGTTLTYDISCNTFRDSKGNALTVFMGAGAGSSGNVIMSGTIFNNRIGVSGVAGSGAAASGIAVDGNGDGTHTVLIKNNQIFQHNEAGIILHANDGSSTLNATVIGNTVSQPGSFGFAAFFAEVGAIPSTDNNRLNLKLGGTGAERNNFVDGDPGNFSDVLFSKIGAGTQFNLSRGVSAASDVPTIVQANNISPITVIGAGGESFVNTVPILPIPISETCTPP